ncbi:MAG: SDR family NAD(P)-dependent oxidoreductase, partial [Proteobacteria bacterium]|nr:SDR family NAD(P)-dependent oxidoreductase [Pseudomonadota bacterium]
MGLKHALVTGAARGIGLATTKKLLGLGWRVAMIDIDGDELRRASEPLKDVLPIEADISDPVQVDRL